MRDGTYALAIQYVLLYSIYIIFFNVVCQCPYESVLTMFIVNNHYPFNLILKYQMCFIRLPFTEVQSIYAFEDLNRLAC